MKISKLVPKDYWTQQSKKKQKRKQIRKIKCISLALLGVPIVGWCAALYQYHLPSIQVPIWENSYWKRRDKKERMNWTDWRWIEADGSGEEERRRWRWTGGGAAEIEWRKERIRRRSTPLTSLGCHQVSERVRRRRGKEFQKRKISRAWVVCPSSGHREIPRFFWLSR